LILSLSRARARRVGVRGARASAVDRDRGAGSRVCESRAFAGVSWRIARADGAGRGRG